MVDLQSILPTAVAWLELEMNKGLEQGRRLSEHEYEIAKSVGVRNPQDVRLFITDELPFPEQDELRQAANTLQLLGSATVGMALGYSIRLRPKAYSFPILAHECRHVAQFEMTGSFASFISEYLGQLIEYGYAGAPFEIDARRHEGRWSPCHQ